MMIYSKSSLLMCGCLMIVSADPVGQFRTLGLHNVNKLEGRVASI